MILTTIFVLALQFLALGLASPLIARNDTQPPSNVTVPAALLKRQDAPSVIESIKHIGSELANLNSVINTLELDQPLSIVKSLELEAKTIRVQTAIKTSTIYTRHSPQFSESESHTVSASIMALQQQVDSVLDNIVLHRTSLVIAAFSNDDRDLSRTMAWDLHSTKLLLQTFGKTIKMRLEKPYAEVAPLVIDQIAMSYEAAIQNWLK